MRRTLKATGIGVGALVLSTIAIQASDLLRGVDGNLTGLVQDAAGPCGAGAVQLQLNGASLCVDAFEAAPSASCPYATPQNQSETATNMLETSCVPVTESGRMPWRFVSQSEAQQLCARTGKRLPTNAEWHRISLPLIDQSNCVVDGNKPLKTGTQACATEAGVHDLVGNVWEWLDESVANGEYDGRSLPATGYVKVVDNNGVVLETSDSADILYGEDYAWTQTEGVFGMIRGGFFGGGSDAGVFAQNLSVPFDLRTSGLGFRCVRDL